MRPIVMVHGAWGGSYGFRKVRPLLSAAGCDVFTPSLTGIGERSHLSNPGIDLRTHVTDVVNTVLYEDLDDIVLLGFSYGGMVATGTLDHIGSRVHDLVYLDAFVPADGESTVAVRGGSVDSTIELGQQHFAPPLPRELDDPADAAWSDARRTPQPLKTFTDPVALSKPLESWDFSLTYIKATADANEPDDSAFWRAGRAAEASSAWAYHEIATNHLIPFTHPAELATILIDLASA
jgi:pimeloyl-ACP methyl ester carboxylesterase